MGPMSASANRAAAVSASGNTKDEVWWIGRAREPVTGSGFWPAWIWRVSKAQSWGLSGVGAVLMAVLLLGRIRGQATVRTVPARTGDRWPALAVDVGRRPGQVFTQGTPPR